MRQRCILTCRLKPDEHRRILIIITIINMRRLQRSVEEFDSRISIGGNLIYQLRGTAPLSSTFKRLVNQNGPWMAEWREEGLWREVFGSGKKRAHDLSSLLKIQIDRIWSIPWATQRGKWVSRLYHEVVLGFAISQWKQTMSTPPMNIWIRNAKNWNWM